MFAFLEIGDCHFLFVSYFAVENATTSVVYWIFRLNKQFACVSFIISDHKMYENIVLKPLKRIIFA